jgi:SAM-dependent methyltransferase
MAAGKGVDIVCDCQNMDGKVKDADFDNVLFTNTIEHLFYPYSAISEIYRVLKLGGYCYATCPVEGYPYHEDPVDTMLRLSTLEDWKKYFNSAKWEIDLFKRVRAYRESFNRVDEVSLIRAKKI